ncbi:MAG: CCA tRNA nucleotidyltransferase [Candidatus Cloacimonetes bacterium]|nr:CCA tRNA nucleotidyltransferase [Candidatus Cloacimonadota bacterium]
MKEIIKTIADTIVGSCFWNKTFIVGGYVRDLIMGIECNDLDIVVAFEDGGKELAQMLYEKGISTKPVIFERFGTAIINIGGHQIEFVMTRKEAYSACSRKPDVAAGSLEEDILRRDFTINSLSMNINTGDISDLTGKGREDITNKIIRTVSNPELTFKEDPLRMLRAVRFAVQLNFEIEAQTQDGIKQQADELAHISWERKRDELTKILLSKYPAHGIEMLKQFGLMKHLIPELEEIIELPGEHSDDLDVYSHSLKVIEHVRPHLGLRLAGLLHNIAKDTIPEENEIICLDYETRDALLIKQILKRLMFPNKVIKVVIFLVDNHTRLNFMENMEMLSNTFVMGFIKEMKGKLDILFEFIQADKISHLPKYCKPDFIPVLKKRIDKIRKQFEGRTMPVKGVDIMEYFNISAGEKVGELLKKAETIWWEHPEWNKESILQEIKL